MQNHTQLHTHTTHTHTLTHTHTHAHTHTRITLIHVNRQYIPYHMHCLVVVDCDDPGTPLNGNRQLNLTTFGSTVEYSCNDGYELVGRQQRRCGGSGRWAGSLPVCSPTDCGDPGRPRNGDRVLSDTSLGSQVLYICNPGFEITGSQRRVCETSSSWSNSLPVCTGKPNRWKGCIGDNMTHFYICCVYVSFIN